MKFKKDTGASKISKMNEIQELAKKLMDYYDAQQEAFRELHAYEKINNEVNVKHLDNILDIIRGVERKQEQRFHAFKAFVMKIEGILENVKFRNNEIEMNDLLRRLFELTPFAAKAMSSRAVVQTGEIDTRVITKVLSIWFKT